ncbi:MAG: cell division protein FtsX, partial [Candidatus Saccharibacteria bacterium]
SYDVLRKRRRSSHHAHILVSKNIGIFSLGEKKDWEKIKDIDSGTTGQVWKKGNKYYYFDDLGVGQTIDDVVYEIVDYASLKYLLGTNNINSSTIRELINNKKLIAFKGEEVSTASIKYKDPKRDASFAGDRRVAVDSIGRWVNFAEKMGLVISIVLITISSLVVFNTIRMAIFNRKEEIQMMKLIGADKGFIRGPFIVEAIVYGFIAAVIAMGLGVSGLMLSRVKLETYGIQIESTMHIIIAYAPFVLLGLIVIGAIIGIISSLLATRRYLKI